MYLDHFGLAEPPFRITPNTDFFYAGANRGATLDALVYAITHDEGIVKVSGEVGSGKTMLCRALMDRLPPHVTIIYLANPSLSRDDILYAIADELRLDVPENARTTVVLRALQNHLIKSFGEGRQIVVLIDEAHAMPADTLEEIRLLSNLESNRNKLLQLVLFGQPELNDVLAQPNMRQLKERITHNFNLEPLVRDDIAGYLEFRIRAAGYKGPSLFAPPAVKAIATTSLGLTRRINILADKALLAAFSAGSHQIGPREIQAAIKDCDFSDATYANSRPHQAPPWLWGLLAGTVILGLLFGAWTYLHSDTDGAGLAAAVNVPPPSQAASAAVPIAPAAISSPPSMTAEPPPGAATPAPVAAEAPAPATAAVEATPANPPSLPAASPAPSLTTKHLDAGKEWLATTSDQRWFLQLYANDANQLESIENYLTLAAESGMDMRQTRVYLSDLSGKTRYGVIYGDYLSRKDALAAVATLPKSVRSSKPYPRQAIKLR